MPGSAGQRAGEGSGGGSVLAAFGAGVGGLAAWAGQGAGSVGLAEATMLQQCPSLHRIWLHSSFPVTGHQ